MRPEEGRPDSYLFDYRMPAKTNHAKYYYRLSYDYSSGTNQKNSSENYSDVYELKLINQYVLQLDSNRGPVGSTISILGRNFSPGDTVYFGRQALPTDFNSSTSLSFQVPPVPSRERSFEVSIKTVQGKYIDAGRFRVDNALMTVLPESGSSLSLIANSGVARMIFEIAYPAPFGGLPVDVTTDIPQSVIMDEVLIPEGQRQIVVEVHGGSPGQGTLFVKANGFDPVEMPVTVF